MFAHPMAGMPPIASGRMLTLWATATDPQRSCVKSRIRAMLISKTVFRRSGTLVLSFVSFVAIAFLLTLIDDDVGSYIAGAMYFFTAIFLGYLAVSSDRYRTPAISMLGGITPFLLVLIYISADFFVQQHEGLEAFPFYAIWVMGIGAFFFSLVSGLALSWIEWPRNLLARYCLAATVAVGMYLLFTIILD